MSNERPIRLNKLIYGTVQRVGYRHLVQGIVRQHRITGISKGIMSNHC